MTNKIYDVAIIGAGPGGLSTAVYALRSGRSVAIIEKYMVGGQVALTQEIKNYPGFTSVSGFELSQHMLAQAESLGAEMIYGEVSNVDFENPIKSLTVNNSQVLAKSVVVSTGAKARKIEAEGEEQFDTRGVHYCAVCDGAFYKGKTIAVIGGGNSGVEDASYLAKLAKKLVYVNKYDYFKAQQILIDEFNEIAEQTKNVEFVNNSFITKIIGDNTVKQIETTNRLTQEKQLHDVDALFVAVGRIPDTEFLKGKIELDPQGYIVANEDLETSVKGVFACGDVRVKKLRQIATATADGAIAGTNVNNFLNTVKI